MALNTGPSADEPCVIAIDSGYIRPKLDAVHLIIENGRAAFVDTGTAQSVPLMLQALEEQGLSPADVDYVFLTHVHLDHAGGAGVLMQRLPKAQCVVHPRGARHMIDPTKLTAAAKDVYGETVFRRLYGELSPIPAERIITVEDGQQLALAGRAFEFIHTPGHANHHYCMIDRKAKIIFSGDTFGMSYRELDTDQGAFILPITTPSQFDPQAAHASIDRLMSYEPRAIYLTHYSRVEGLTRLAADLHEELDVFVAIAQSHANSSNRTQAIIADMYSQISERLDQHGVRDDPVFRHKMLDGDIRLNVQGLEVWLQQSM